MLSRSAMVRTVVGLSAHVQAPDQGAFDVANGLLGCKRFLVFPVHAFQLFVNLIDGSVELA